MVDERAVDEDKRATLRRFAALGATAPSFAGGASGETDGNSEARDAIPGYLAATPGAHFSKLRDDLKLGTGEAQHHLRELEDDGTIESREDGNYVRYFPAGRFTEFEQVALGTLRRETQRHMVMELLGTPGLSGTKLAESLDVSRPTVYNHASDLTTAGVLEREDGYRLRYPETVITLIVRYADSFGRRARTFASEVDALLAYDP
jgi:predicted transcriptional regulator